MSKPRRLDWQLKRYPLQIVVWDDHAGPANHVDAREVTLVTRVTVGWVVRETDDHIVIASTLDDDSSSFSDMNALGKGMILSRKDLG
jgi:hypothetical protein